MWSGTPEYAEEARQSRNLASIGMESALGKYLGFQQPLGGMVGQPYTYGTVPQQDTGLTDLLTGGLGLLGNLGGAYLGGSMTANALKDALGGFGGVKDRGATWVTPYENFYQSPEQIGDYMGYRSR